MSLAIKLVSLLFFSILLGFWLSNNNSPIIYSDSNITDKVKDSIVWVKYDFSYKTIDGYYFETLSSGSGVIINNENNSLTVYTNRHVVDCSFSNDCFQKVSENVTIRTQDGVMHKVNQISFSESDIDLVILRIDCLNSTKYQKVFYIDSFKAGESVIAVGYPSYAINTVEFSISSGKITKIKEVISQSTGFGYRTIESDAYTYFGSSGGGLFDSDGNLIGVNTWLRNGETIQSIAIDVSSIKENKFVYCKNNTYYSEGKCNTYCNQNQVKGLLDNNCYDICSDFYCNSEQPSANDQRCKDEGYILGSDGYCHLPCGSSNSYCLGDSICLDNRCYPQCSQGYLWADGTCRQNQ